MPIDLVPFGFTPTESLAYGALLDLGPSSGYAAAKVLNIARANGYQALDGLVTKGAAVLTDRTPRRYRAVRPRDLFALLAERSAAKLDRLEEQVEDRGAEGATAMVRVYGERAIRDLVVRTVVRAKGQVDCVAPGDFLAALAPAWRARVAAGAETRLWSVDPAPDLPIPVGPAEPLFPSPSLLVAMGTEALCADLGVAPAGYWTSEPMLAGVIAAALERAARA